MGRENAAVRKFQHRKIKLWVFLSSPCPRLCSVAELLCPHNTRGHDWLSLSPKLHPTSSSHILIPLVFCSLSLSTCSPTFSRWLTASLLLLRHKM